MKHETFHFLFFLLLLTFSGCSVARTSLPSFTQTLARGEYQSAKALAKGEIGRHNTTQDLLWNLQVAAIERLLKRYASSNAYFDRAEDSFRYYDQQIAAEKSISASKGLLFNDSALPYLGKNADRIMVNTYKAINFATLGDAANARVEFNRALHRQNMAKALFSHEADTIKRRLSSDNHKPRPEEKIAVATINNPEFDRIIRQRYKNLEEFTVFSDFVNPFPTYIAGLFFWLEGDTAKAVDILKEAYAMSQEHPIVASDFARAARGESPSNEMWIIYENGLAPGREEVRIDLPLILQNGAIQYVGAALPDLTPGKEALPFLTFSTDNGGSAVTEPLASMSAIIATEFKKELPGILLREISRIALKTSFQYQMQKNYGNIGGIISGLYQAATTAVDIRAWSALPENFQLAHLAIPDNRRITLNIPGHSALTIIVPTECDNVILYIRIISSNVVPVYDFIKF